MIIEKSSRLGRQTLGIESSQWWRQIRSDYFRANPDENNKCTPLYSELSLAVGCLAPGTSRAFQGAIDCVYDDGAEPALVLAAGLVSDIASYFLLYKIYQSLPRKLGFPVRIGVMLAGKIALNAFTHIAFNNAESKKQLEKF